MVKHTNTSLLYSDAEHVGIQSLPRKRLKSIKKTAVSDHLLECNCSIDFNDFDILAYDAN